MCSAQPPSYSEPCFALKVTAEPLFSTKNAAYHSQMNIMMQIKLRNRHSFDEVETCPLWFAFQSHNILTFSLPPFLFLSFAASSSCPSNVLSQQGLDQLLPPQRPHSSISVPLHTCCFQIPRFFPFVLLAVTPCQLCLLPLPPTTAVAQGQFALCFPMQTREELPPMLDAATKHHNLIMQDDRLLP